MHHRVPKHRTDQPIICPHYIMTRKPGKLSNRSRGILLINHVIKVSFAPAEESAHHTLIAFSDRNLFHRNALRSNSLNNLLPLVRLGHLPELRSVKNTASRNAKSLPLAVDATSAPEQVAKLASVYSRLPTFFGQRRRGLSPVRGAFWSVMQTKPSAAVFVAGGLVFGGLNA